MGLGGGLALAVLAAFALNSSYLLQHVGGASAPAVNVRRPMATIRGLMASRVWLAGTVIGTVGSLLHMGALAVAPLSLVGVFSVGGLAMLVPVAARVTRTALTRLEILGTGAVVLALAVLAISERRSVGSLPFHAATPVILAAIIAVAAVIGLARPRGPAVLGAVTGMLYGVADASVRMFSDAVRVSLKHAVLSPWIALFVLACGVAFFTFQRGLQTGRAIPVIAVMTTVADVAAIVLGVTLRGESLGGSAAATTVHVLAIGVALAGAFVLAMAQRRIEAPRLAVA